VTLGASLCFQQKTLSTPNVTLRQSLSLRAPEGREGTRRWRWARDEASLPRQRAPGIAVPSLTPSLPHQPRAGLGMEGSDPTAASPLGTAAFQLAKPSASPLLRRTQPQRSPSPGLTASRGRATETGSRFAAPGFRSGFPRRLHESFPPAGKP